MIQKAVFLLLTTAVISQCAISKTPKLCKLRDKEFTTCLASSIQGVVPILAKGIPKLGVFPIDPLHIDLLDLSDSPGKTLNVRHKFMDVDLSGLGSAQIKKVRMTRPQFHFIHDEIKHLIKKEDTIFRDAISTEERLAVCFRYLSTGMCFRTLAQSYRMGETTVGLIIKQVCDALWKQLQPKFLAVPQQDDWIKIAAKFQELWQFPTCVGALDGKHVTIKKPVGSESEHRNYKDTFSFVLMATVDAEYKFTLVDIGSPGRFSDGSIFMDSCLGKRLRQNQLSFPPFTELEGEAHAFPFVFVGDEAFPLMTNLMRPYPKAQLTAIKNKVFNYRLSRARRMVESSFGILATRFRALLKPFECQLQTAISAVKAAIVLHNFLRQGGGCIQQELQFFEGIEPREPSHNNQMISLQRIGCNASRLAFETREKFADYFLSPAGAVPWQMNAIEKGHF